MWSIRNDTTAQVYWNEHLPAHPKHIRMMRCLNQGMIGTNGQDISIVSMVKDCGIERRNTLFSEGTGRALLDNHINITRRVQVASVPHSWLSCQSRAIERYWYGDRPFISSSCPLVTKSPVRYWSNGAG